MGGGLGEKVVLSLRLPVTDKAGPLASCFTDCLTLQVVSAPSEFHSLGKTCLSGSTIRLRSMRAGGGIGIGECG